VPWRSDHLLGIEPYAVTYTGYILTANLLDWEAPAAPPNEPPPSEPPPSSGSEPPPSSGSESPPSQGRTVAEHCAGW
jgi:hypothetical protein